MDWYSWLSKTNLDSSFIYEYSVAFARNELQEDDLTYFNHEFLQSIGISIAKHRLEILKLARKHQIKVKGLMKIVETVNKSITKSLFTKNAILGRLATFNKRSLPEYQVTPYNNQWNGALKRINEQDYKRGGGKINTTWSGPLRSQEININNKAVVVETNRRKISHTVSGPLYGNMMQSPVEHGRVKERIHQAKCRRSHTVQGFEEQIDEYYRHQHHKSDKVSGGGNNDTHVSSLWSLMFQDLKPT